MHHMTKITRDAFHGKPYTGERDLSDNRRLASRKANRAKTAKPPRSRDGQAFPGGKHLRRALKRLSLRVAAFEPSPKGTTQHCKPGSMAL